MQVIRYPEKSAWKEIVARPTFETASLESIVSGILNDVKSNGDEALRRYTAEFDKAEIDDFAVSEAEFAAAEEQISAELKTAILHAKGNLEIFHRAQIETPERIETTPGVVCWRESRAMSALGFIFPAEPHRFFPPF
jgi:histidinol dehydrogenase